MLERPARHTLVWLSADADWRADLSAHAPRLAVWFAQSFPAVVARRAADDSDPRLRLGVPLPPAEGKQRLSLRVPLCDVARMHAPPALSELLAAGDAVVPGAWQESLHDLQALAPARVFGAFAWQWLTALPYVHERSDIDLLWQVNNAAQAEALIARLLAWETRHPHRLDGELCLPDGGAVNWRELAGRSRQVLVKRLDGAALEARDALFATCEVIA
ncbi:malonate decarboxylase holo-[acyl-carrier-protein] synthase [Stenotrophomonas indicatrix]|uniref:malonate decarboxylase holo-[acyl-carrier-protein] synthase n=1 Tax=Stenotrophomonas indicatrix TaxID=2045451 RepID=UPI00215AB3AC|nr:malonate decarboxylase holo-[acyl-carrier-protein] synthase [Stenotrophomonas indicatrix]MCR8713919.1 malonate decarboxylase holo-[acyl-carrier-protein] synthase [Stenotrophomonas indicatrix]